jgi:hypothetical protein
MHGLARLRAHANHQERDHHGDVGQCVEQKAVRFAQHANQNAGDRRADQPAAVGHQRGQRDGVGQVFLAVDQFQQIGMTDRQLDRHQNAEEHRQRDDVPRRYDAGQRQRGQCRSL